MSVVLEPVLGALKKGELVLLLDDVGTRRKAYFLAPAATISAAQITEMVNIGRGLVCAAIGEQRVRDLGLPPMVRRKSSPAVDFTVSVEARQGVSTGISAPDRSKTLQTLAKTVEPKVDLVTPGHIFPILAKAGGVLVRNDVAEAAVDLMNLSGRPPVAAICHCLNTSGDLLSDSEIDELVASAKRPVTSISEVIRHRLAHESILDRIAEARLPTAYAGEFTAVCFRSRSDDAEHLALVRGDLAETDASGLQKPVLVRVQAEHRFADLLGVGAPAGSDVIEAALKKIAERGRGVFVYVRHPRKGILRQQAAAYSKKADANPAGELREHGIGAQILSALGVKRIELLMKSDRGIPGISAFNLEVTGRQTFGAQP